MKPLIKEIGCSKAQKRKMIWGKYKEGPSYNQSKVKWLEAVRLPSLAEPMASLVKGATEIFWESAKGWPTMTLKFLSSSQLSLVIENKMNKVDV